ncbi:MAG: hypothetical protein IJM09_05705 [Neisseriaceae bacterium]|nr:hypothetical protein [Neisseriaceae bacterium]
MAPKYDPRNDAKLKAKSVENALKYKQGNIGSLNEYQTRRLLASIYLTESSGGNIDAMNKQGYSGKYQMSAGYLASVGWATCCPRV